jgi:capsular exopolysaccharide synthesis family protein
MLFFPDNVNLKNELEILKSKSLLKRVVEKLDLQLSYFNKGNVRTTNVYGSSPIKLEIISLTDSLAGFTLDIEATEKNFKFSNNSAALDYNTIFQTNAGSFKLEKIPGKSFLISNSDNYLIRYTSLDLAASSLSSSLSTAQTIEQATILDISMETDNIQLGKDVINTLMKEYTKMNIESKREISQITMQFIDERLDTLKNELGGVETGLLRFKEKNEIIDLPTQSTQYFQNFSELNKQLVTQQVQIGIVDYLTDYINEPAKRFSMVPTDLGIQEPALMSLVSQYNALQLQHNTLVQTTGPSNASLLAIESGIDKLRQQMQEALKSVKHSYRIAANKMQEQANHYEANIRSVPSKAKNLLDIERQQKIKQDLYLFLLQKREEAAISAAATVSGSYPIEEASASGNPVKPQTATIYLIALFLGLLLPVLVIAVMEMLNDKIRERGEIVNHTQAPIVGEIGHAGEETLVVKTVSRTVVAEQFRIMRTNVQYLVKKINVPVMLVTSSVSGEGKSFVATNYGAALALTGKKTVVLEFDIRKPRLLKGLNMPSTKGLSNFIIGTATMEEIIKPVPDFNNLYVIGCGPVPPNPSELLLDKQVEELFKVLRTKFDYIIIDSAPVGLVSDAFTLSAFADASIYIVRQGYTLRRQLNMVQDLYLQKRLPNMGLVINDIQTRGRYKGYYGYGGGSYYGYGYGYGGDYFQESSSAKRKSRLKIRK